MKIDFTGRGVDINPELRAHTEAKLERLKKHLDDIRDVKVILSVEKYRQKAEINLQARRQTFHSHEETNEMLQSIDRVVEKLEKQARRFKAKRIKTKRKPNGLAEPLEEIEAGAPSPEPGIRIIKKDNFVLKPMSPEEAVEELQKFNQEFIIFQNSDSEQMGVAYRRRDGHFGYIEPSF